MTTSTETVKHGEYSFKGDYHRELDKKWIYYPVYVEKMVRVRRYLADFKGKKILDMGCGEGVLVHDLRKQGFDITGVDFNYESEFIRKGSILATGLPAGSFDLIICLDVIEHLNFDDQEKALREIHRLLKPGGAFYATIPNLAHFASRITFLLFGKLIRTSSIDRHPGDRPFGEYKKLISSIFVLEKTFGIFPTYPFITLATYLSPGSVVWWHKLYNALVAVPTFCFLNFFVCKKKEAVH
jgi:SAM-dependent methyltransferase